MTGPPRAAGAEAVPVAVPMAAGVAVPGGGNERGACEFCGAERLAWRKCKLVCEACANINKSCADL